MGVIDAQPIVLVRAAKPGDESGAQHVHRRALQPAAGVKRQNQHHLRTFGLAQPGGEGLSDPPRCQVLVLGVDPAPGRGDAVEIEPLDLPDLGHAVVRGAGACDGHIDVDGLRIDAGGPGQVAFHRARCQSLARREPPALAREITERGSGFAGHDHLHVVKGSVTFAVRIDPARVVGQVLRAVPAAVRRVEPPCERDAVVDDHDLLMLARAERMVIVEAQLQSAVMLELEPVDRQPLPLERVQHRPVPVQHAHLQASPPAHERVQEIAEFGRKPVVLAVPEQAQSRVDVPGENQHGAPRLTQRRTQGREVRVAVDQEREPRGSRDAPTVLARPEETGVIHLWDVATQAAPGETAAAREPSPRNRRPSRFRILPAGLSRSASSPACETRPSEEVRPSRRQRSSAIRNAR